jgi:malate dehydrogenase (oxaloacetate-decarboxylating)(NADP+)
VADFHLLDHNETLILYPLQLNILEAEIQTAARIAKLIFDFSVATVPLLTGVVVFIRKHLYKPEYRTEKTRVRAVA